MASTPSPGFIQSLGEVLDWRNSSRSLADVLAAIPALSDITLPSGSYAMIRADLDVPIDSDGQPRDWSRVEACLPTVRACLDRGWRVILVGHIGRGGTESLRPVASAYSSVLSTDVPLIEDWFQEGQISTACNDQVAALSNGSLLMLDNLRKYEEETALWNASRAGAGEAATAVYDFAAALSGLADLHVNEAIAAGNPDTSSTAAALLAPHVALGIFIRRELQDHLLDATRADLVIFSGVKANKLDDLEQLIANGSPRTVIVAGALAIACAAATSPEKTWGRALTDPSYVGYVDGARREQGKRIVEKCAERSINLVLPVDFVISDGSLVESISDGEAQFDIGPKSSALFEEVLDDYVTRSNSGETAGILFYNGVFGMFEDDRFANGTERFVQHLAKLKKAGVKTYVGGGEGRSALLKYASIDDVTHAFTAGGTVLKILSGKLPAYLLALAEAGSR